MEGSESSTTAAPWATPNEPSEASTEASTESDAFAEHPEVFVGAAFASGLGVALVLRWLGSR